MGMMDRYSFQNFSPFPFYKLKQPPSRFIPGRLFTTLSPV
ncbi:hypothetical protein B4098_0067 [Heyndrickxia coagulans]|uniref:Uncharacterized protein n=1 Tax=Heyndrickxia coagulans TaxID=1398 RepID=A0A150JQY0_HEYCO|nr:hypothetical protein B4098_0067 [Heyndrickxia coagulans]KYC66129.1 hypothetical protein B4099_0093 [Heyndrickxia coagulans]